MWSWSDEGVPALESLPPSLPPSSQHIRPHERESCSSFLAPYGLLDVTCNLVARAGVGRRQRLCCTWWICDRSTKAQVPSLSAPESTSILFKYMFSWERGVFVEGVDDVPVIAVTLVAAPCAGSLRRRSMRARIRLSHDPATGMCDSRMWRR